MNGLNRYVRNTGYLLGNNSKLNLDSKTETKLFDTGTTICAVQFKHGIVLGADTRATAGNLIAEKNCTKLNAIADNIYTAGSGGSADLIHTVNWLHLKARLQELNTRAKVRVETIIGLLTTELFQWQGYKVCAMLVGGVDVTGPSLYHVSPHGTCNKIPFGSMGSGSLLALAALETGYHDDMELEEAKALVLEGIKSGIYGDLYSGGHADICVITQDTSTLTRNVYDVNVAENILPPPRVDIPRSTNPVTNEQVEKWRSVIQIETQSCEVLTST